MIYCSLCRSVEKIFLTGAITLSGAMTSLEKQIRKNCQGMSVTAHPTMLMNDDSEILHEICERPDEGARLLVGKYGRRLYAAAMRLCRNEADAEDLVSRTLARVIQNAGSFKGDSEFFTWQCAIMVNFFKMDRRRKGGNSLEFPEEWPEVSDERPSPAEAIERADDAREVRAAVAALPDRLRETVVLFYFGGMSVPEIAKSLGEPEGTVYYRLHEAKKAIREKISGKIPRRHARRASNRM